jgi:6-phosphogluconate dehydrogenase (decarboxylating)
MELGAVGLGTTCGSMARRLSRCGHLVVGYSRTPEVWREPATEGKSVAAAESIGGVAAELGLLVRLVRREEESFAPRVLAPIRHRFGCHSFKLASGES